MVAIDEFDALGLGAALDDLGGTLEFEVLDEGDDVAVGEDVAVGILDDARDGLGFALLAGPFVAAGHAFPVVVVIEDIGHFTGRTDGFAHRGVAP